MSIFTLPILAAFALISNEDPITQKRIETYVTIEGENVFGLSCEPGRDEINIVFIPDYYRGARIGSIFWQPSSVSRFDMQERAEGDNWAFGDSYLLYSPVPIFERNSKKARFIDYLARSESFSIRYEARPDDVETVTFEYTIDLPTLRQFIADCGPRRVIEHLREMESPVAPQL